LFDSLTQKFSAITDRLRGTARITEEDLDLTLRDMRIALLEADVALPVVRQLLDQVRERGLGEDVAKSLKPGQLIVKILHDVLAETLGGEPQPLNLQNIPSVILLCGLQGAGKTTTAGKLARLLIQQGKKVALTSVDSTRPAAREQLEILAKQIDVPYFSGRGKRADQMATDALNQSRKHGIHVLILDTAGRQTVDNDLMAEINKVQRKVQASERLLVLDSMMGQASLEIAESFHANVRLTGCILTKTDADVRGGAAISVAQSTGVPLRFVGTGEKLEAFEFFDPQRMAGRILGQGDIVGLVEKIQSSVDQEQAEKLAKKASKGKFDLQDFSDQLGQMQNMGGMAEMVKMLPGVRVPQEALASVDDKPVRQMQAMISSMTPDEREKPRIISGSRKRRIAMGSGTSIQEVNRLLKQFSQMQKMMKKMRGSKGKRMMASLAGKLGMPGMPR